MSRLATPMDLAIYRLKNLVQAYLALEERVETALRVYKGKQQLLKQHAKECTDLLERAEAVRKIFLDDAAKFSWLIE
jgi:hypothetical protein